LFLVGLGFELRAFACKAGMYLWSQASSLYCSFFIWTLFFTSNWHVKIVHIG
jgi:hypothetical protein